MNDKISVYGGTGYIGKHFCNTYSEDVILLKRGEYSPLSKKIVYFISTTDNYNVLHDLHVDIDTNLSYLMNVLNECKNRDVEFTFISSWFVYGDTDLPANESSVCKPRGFYSITKYAAELLIESFCKTFNLNYKILRLGNVIGFSDNNSSKKKNALQFLINEMKENKDIKLYKEGIFYRDYIDVRDVVSGIKLAVERGINGNIYNLSSGIPSLFKDVIDYAKAKLNSTSNIGSMEPTDFHKIVQVESMYLDTSKMKSIGFKPKFTIYDTIDSML
jgi:nucleoside-diphosphate-sugar epimerase